MLVKMFVGRFLLLALMFSPFFSLTVYIVEYQPKFITQSQSILIILLSCFSQYITMFLIFLFFERISFLLNHDVN